MSTDVSVVQQAFGFAPDPGRRAQAVPGRCAGGRHQTKPASRLTCEQLAAELSVSEFAVLDLLDDAVISADGNLCFGADQTVAARAHLHAARTGMTARTVRLPAQLHLGVHAPCPERVLPAGQGRLGRKPAGGLWTSTLTDDGDSAFGRFAVAELAERYQGVATWRLDVPAARLLVLDGRADVEAFYRRFALADGSGAAEGRSTDWEAIAAVCDGLHVSARTPRQADTGDDLYGFDCESTWWCRWPDGAQVGHDGRGNESNVL